MDNKDSEALVKAIKNATMSGEQLLTGKVVAVDEAENTCDVDIDGDAPTIFGVRLRAIVDNTTDGIIQIPAIDSSVLIGKLTTSLWCVLVFSKIDKCKLKIGSQTLIIDDNVFIFNDGGLDGMVKINPLVDKISAIENKLNSVIQKLVAWIPVPNDGGAALKALVASLTPITPITQKSDLENEKIKQ